MKILLLVFLLITSCIEIYSQPEAVKTFFDELLNNKNDLSEYDHKDALDRSKRLGINYLDVKNKFLISYDIDDEIKQKIKEDGKDYDLLYEQLNNNYSKVIFKLTDNSYSKEFYFKDEKFVSPSSFFTKEWEV